MGIKPKRTWLQSLLETVFLEAWPLRAIGVRILAL